MWIAGSFKTSNRSSKLKMFWHIDSIKRFSPSAQVARVRTWNWWYMARAICLGSKSPSPFFFRVASLSSSIRKEVHSGPLLVLYYLTKNKARGRESNLSFRLSRSFRRVRLSLHGFASGTNMGRENSERGISHKEMKKKEANLDDEILVSFDREIFDADNCI